MIATLTGTITHKTNSAAIIQVQGVGYLAHLPQNELAQLKTGQDITLYTYLAVKEDALDIYASADPRVIAWFKMLLNVKGVGPKSSLAILSAAGPKDLSNALHAQSPEVLVNCGVSKKVSERVIMELKTKAADLIGAPTGATTESITRDTEALQALEALGYSREHAREALKEATGDDVGARVKSALKTLGT
ncbi:MAG: Holliday junction branch migration protein RuvA [Patescibacteria group bacterium]|nr:Holliday junction branch migration protein RuvA [Patescibacteria group bacterium]